MIIKMYLWISCAVSPVRCRRPEDRKWHSQENPMWANLPDQRTDEPEIPCTYQRRTGKDTDDQLL